MTPQEDWVRCRPWIEAALERAPGLETIEDVERLLKDGTYRLWSSPNAAAISQIVEFQRRKAVKVLNGGGNLSELIEQIEPRIRAYGKVNGCGLIMGMGRKGWERALEGRGYRFGWITMIKDIE